MGGSATGSGPVGEEANRAGGRACCVSHSSGACRKLCKPHGYCKLIIQFSRLNIAI